MGCATTCSNCSTNSVTAQLSLFRRLPIHPRAICPERHSLKVTELVAATGKGKAHYGFTFSDLTQRLLPAIVLDAYPSRGVDAGRALEIAKQMQPTPPFEEQRL